MTTTTVLPLTCLGTEEHQFLVLYVLNSDAEVMPRSCILANVDMGFQMSPPPPPPFSGRQVTFYNCIHRYRRSIIY